LAVLGEVYFPSARGAGGFWGGHMKRRLFVATSALILLVSAMALAGNWRKLALWAGVVKPGPTADGKGALLPTGWKITPAGRQVPLPGDMVMNPATGSIFVSGGGAPSQQFLATAKNRRIGPEMIEALRLPALRLQLDKVELR
jgi:hypothetical protein